MRTQITGATGFVGQNLLPYLTNLNIETTSLTRGELQNGLSFEGADAIIHLAGKAHDLKKTVNPAEYYEVNFELTKKLYDTFLRSRAKKFVFISSVKAAADSVVGTLTEDSLPVPQTHYGKSKLMAENYIRTQPLPEGKSYYILRPCMIHGPGNKGNLNLLYQFVKKGIPYPLAAFKNSRSFLSIENLCFVIATLLKRDIPSGIYHVSDDEPLSTNDVVMILAKSLNKEAKLLNLPKSIVSSLAKVGNLLRLPLNTERLNKMTESYIVSNQKIQDAINMPLPITSRQGLLLTAESFRKQQLR